jgi:hypothetical protein
VRPERTADNSAAVVVPNVKVKMEAQNCITPLSLLGLLRESFTFQHIDTVMVRPKVHSVTGKNRPVKVILQKRVFRKRTVIQNVTAGEV